MAERQLDAHARLRARRAEALAAEIAAASAFRRSGPMRPAPASTRGSPSWRPLPAARDQALAALRDLGASGMYPSSLADVSALRPHLAAEPACETARALAARLLTLPTHRELAGARRARLLEVVRRLS